jgi:putative ABC transport system permease protein
MNLIALQMLFGDRGKVIGMTLGLTFVSLLITQSSAVFLGIMSRTVSSITDAAIADVWVMDPMVRFVDDIKPLRDTELYRVRQTAGVAWAVPYFKGQARAKLSNGTFQTCNLIGIDAGSLAAGPSMEVGSVSSLRRPDSVLVDLNGARTKLARKDPDGGKSVPLRALETLELNDQRVVVTGLSRVSRTFQSQPVIHTTYPRAVALSGGSGKSLSFVLVRAADGQDPAELAQRIERSTGLTALTTNDFLWKTIWYYLTNTGIPINFGTVIGICFVVGTAIAGQIFQNFTTDNMRHFGALKAMGASEGVLLTMIVLQALLVGAIGYGLGVGGAAMFGYLTRNTEVAFLLPWHLLVISAGAVLAICTLSAVTSIRRVLRLEAAIVFRG